MACFNKNLSYCCDSPWCCSLEYLCSAGVFILFTYLQFQAEICFWSRSSFYPLAVFPVNVFAKHRHSLFFVANNTSYRKVSEEANRKYPPGTWWYNSQPLTSTLSTTMHSFTDGRTHQWDDSIMPISNLHASVHPLKVALYRQWTGTLGLVSAALSDPCTWCCKSLKCVLIWLINWIICCLI